MHELLTPLTSIVGYTELVLESKALTPEDRQCLAAIQLHGDRLARRMQDLVEELPMMALDREALGELVARISRP